MKELLNKHWINILGIVMILSAFFYFLNMETAPNAILGYAKLFATCGVAVLALIMGVVKKKKEKLGTAQILLSSGIGFSFFSIYYAFSQGLMKSLSFWHLFFLGGGVVFSFFLALKYNTQKLAIVGLLGFIIFLGVSEINVDSECLIMICLWGLSVSCFSFSLRRNWIILPYLSFVLILSFISVYSFWYSPENLWKPLVFLVGFFLVNAIGFFKSDISGGQVYKKANSYFGMANSLNFIFLVNLTLWSFSVSLILPMSALGVVFITASLMINSRLERTSRESLTYFISGIFCIIIVSVELEVLTMASGINYLIISYAWLFVISFLYMLVRLVGKGILILPVLFSYVLLVFYWAIRFNQIDFISLSDFKWRMFFNLGAAFWLLLAVLGFSISRFLIQDIITSNAVKTIGDRLIRTMSSSLAFLSHLILVSLISIQIRIFWDTSRIEFFSIELMLSFIWFFYTLIILLCSHRSKEFVYNVFGGIVIIVSLLKVFLFDLKGESSVGKIVYLLIFGVILLAVGKIYGTLKLVSKRVATPDTIITKSISIDESVEYSWKSPWKKF